MSEKEIYINGLRVNYRVAGEGQPVLILHGWGGSSDSWVKVQEILAGQGYKVICPDLPGFGRTVPPSSPWSVKDYTDFIVDFLKELEVDRFFLFGHSFGGRISIKFASQYPERLKSLILCDSAGIKPKLGHKTNIIYWIAKIGNALFSPKHLARLKDTARNIFYVFLRNKDYVRANGVMKETIKKVLDEDLLPNLSKINTKTLIVWGEIDRMVPLKYAYIFKENIKDSRLEVLPKIGHSPHLEVSEKLSEIVLKFLRA
ncbi:MAG: alpha/beta hydrolase [bacterium]